MSGEGIVAASLGTLSGGLVIAQVDEKLREVMQDVIDRPNAPDSRVVTLKITVKPKIDGQDGMNYPELVSSVGATFPGIKNKEESGIVRGGSVYLSTARQTEMALNQPNNVEAFDKAKQRNGGD